MKSALLEQHTATDKKIEKIEKLREAEAYTDEPEEEPAEEVEEDDDDVVPYGVEEHEKQSKVGFFLVLRLVLRLLLRRRRVPMGSLRALMRDR